MNRSSHLELIAKALIINRNIVSIASSHDSKNLIHWYSEFPNVAPACICRFADVYLFTKERHSDLDVFSFAIFMFIISSWYACERKLESAGLHRWKMSYCCSIYYDLSATLILICLQNIVNCRPDFRFYVDRRSMWKEQPFRPTSFLWGCDRNNFMREFFGRRLL